MSRNFGDFGCPAARMARGSGAVGESGGKVPLFGRLFVGSGARRFRGG